MPVSVLVVDDSDFFRKRICKILEGDNLIKVVGIGRNGREAVDLVEKLNPDVITMDYEMPMMDGITAVREIMAKKPTPVLMFSSLTHEGARVTLDALDAGAVDFLPKNFEDISRNNQRLRQVLKEKILGVARSRLALSRLANDPSVGGRTKPAASPSPAPAATTSAAPASPRPVPPPAAPVRESARLQRQPFQVVAIGTSTGGPVALQKVLTRLPANFPRPILLIQHMPGTFTPAFAERLNRLCNIEVKHAEQGDVLRPGVALLAPGGKQMMLENQGGSARVKILDGDERLNYKPSVDVTFGSASRVFPGRVLAVVLTGMGSDGKEGARMLKAGGAQVWAQDEASCVIYGMPQAVVKAGLADHVFSLGDIGDKLIEGVG